MLLFSTFYVNVPLDTPQSSNWDISKLSHLNDFKLEQGVAA